MFLVVIKSLVKRFAKLEIRGHNPKYNRIEIGQHIEKCQGDLRRLVVIQTPVKDHWETLMGKNSQGLILMIMMMKHRTHVVIKVDSKFLEERNYYLMIYKENLQPTKQNV